MHALGPQDAVRALDGQPGLDPRVTRRILGRHAWCAVMAEHHVTLPDVPVDLMGGTPSPWSEDLGADAPPAHLRGLGAQIFWLEWDLATRGDAAPLWSISCDPDLLDDGRVQRRFARDERLRRTLDQALQPDDRDLCWSLVEALPRGRLLHVAPLQRRERSGARLCWWMPSGDVPRWLDQVGVARPHDLATTLFAIAAPHVPVGVQLEICGGAVGDYLAVESPLRWRERPSGLDAGAWLVPNSQAARRLAALRRWVDGPAPAPWRRQMYVKLVHSASGWTPKVYAGATAAAPPSRGRAG